MGMTDKLFINGQQREHGLAQRFESKRPPAQQDVIDAEFMDAPDTPDKEPRILPLAAKRDMKRECGE